MKSGLKVLIDVELSLNIHRLNLCRDEKRTESLQNEIQLNRTAMVSTYTAMKSGLKAICRMPVRQLILVSTYAAMKRDQATG